jgi:hypothetical protein
MLQAQMCATRRAFFLKPSQRSKSSKVQEGTMSVTATAVIKKEAKLDPKKPKDKDKAYYASLSVLNQDGKAYGLPRHLSDFREVAVLLVREAGVTHEQLHEHHAYYERGEEVRLSLILESDDAIKNLGFDPKAA